MISSLTLIKNLIFDIFKLIKRFLPKINLMNKLKISIIKKNSEKKYE